MESIWIARVFRLSLCVYGEMVYATCMWSRVYVSSMWGGTVCMCHMECVSGVYGVCLDRRRRRWCNVKLKGRLRVLVVIVGLKIN